MHTSCESLALTWTQPSDLMPAHISHYSMILSRVTRTGDQVIINSSDCRSTQLKRGGLFAGATYNFQIRAHNPKGASRWTERLLATIPIPTKPPLALAAPATRVSKDSCNVLLMIPPPRVQVQTTACRGVEWIEVQALKAGSTQWVTAIPRAESEDMIVGHLNPANAYSFRLVAHNRLGVSSPGEPTPINQAIIPGLPLTEVQAPMVRATGSASFAIHVPAVGAACQAALTWTVLASLSENYQQENATWRVLATLGQGLQHTVDRMRCPVSGCKFKLRPDVRTWDGGDRTWPIAVAYNKPLPVKPDKAVRIEVMLKATSWNSLMRRELRRALALQLHLPVDPTVLEEHAFSGGVYVIMDLVAVTSNDASLAASLLVGLLEHGDQRVIDTLGVLQSVDISTGVKQQVDGETWHRVQPLSVSPPFDKSGRLIGKVRMPSTHVQLALMGGVLAICVCAWDEAPESVLSFLCQGSATPQKKSVPRF